MSDSTQAQLRPAADARPGLPLWERVLLVVLVITTAVVLCVVIPTGTPRARGDVGAYLINVTVRPGYGFANAEAAVAYGFEICDSVSRGRPYDNVVDQVKADFSSRDDYQASYLISQAANELCPAAIWQLRNSAADYRPPP